MTDLNYAELEALNSEFGALGQPVAVLAFPCDQFHQEPGTDADVAAFARAKGATFPLFSKTNVNGPSQHAVYKELKAALSGHAGHGDIEWNFVKFLVGKDGVAVRRYGKNVSPAQIKPDIEALLAGKLRSGDRGVP